MDARSIAATAANKGILTSAEGLDINFKPKYYFDKAIYDNRVYKLALESLNPSVER